MADRQDRSRRHPTESPSEDDPGPPVSPDRADAGFDSDDDLADELDELGYGTYDEDPLAGGDVLDEEELEEYLDEEGEDEVDDERTGDYQEAEQQGWSFEPRDTSEYIEAARYGDAELVPGITGSTPGRLGRLGAEENVEAPEDERRADEDVLEDVKRVLLEDPLTASLSLDVEVQDGVVALRGEVLTDDDSDNAVAVASRVPGAVEVVDETTVQGL